jgi:hypothetical protein
MYGRVRNIGTTFAHQKVPTVVGEGSRGCLIIVDQYKKVLRAK